MFFSSHDNYEGVEKVLSLTYWERKCADTMGTVLVPQLPICDANI